MSIVALPGSRSRTLIGPTWLTTNPGLLTTTLDAANEAIIFIGRIETSDLGSHTIDTTGSSAIRWRGGSATFANAGTTLKVGIGAVDTGAGPSPRAANAADVITHDVAAVFTGGGGGIAANTSNNSVPTTGTKTIANGDLVAVSIQMTARGGTDSVAVASISGIANGIHHCSVTSFTGGAYATGSSVPNVFITFADGETGWIAGSEVFSTFTTRTWNSTQATKEYGQLYNLPFPCDIYGIYGWIDPDADCDIVLYSDPLGGSPVAEKTVSLDANTMAAANLLRFPAMFPAPYRYTANTDIGAVFKPGASSVSAALKTLGNAGNRVADEWGTSGYGISRASGAFADANSSLDHYYIGLIVGGFDDGASGGGSGLSTPLFGGGLVG